MCAFSARKKKSKIRDFVDFIGKEFKENRTRFFTIIGFTVGFIIFGVFFFARIQTLEFNASDRLTTAYMYISAGETQQAVNFLNDTINLYPKTPSAYQARLVKADLLIEHKEYDLALPLLKETYEKAKPETFKPLALVRIIYLYDCQKDYDNAIMYANEFINKYSTHFYIKDIYMNLAHYYISKDSPEDAKRVYNEIITMFPETAQAEYAAKVLEEIEK